MARGQRGRSQARRFAAAEALAAGAASACAPRTASACTPRSSGPRTATPSCWRTASPAPSACGPTRSPTSRTTTASSPSITAATAEVRCPRGAAATASTTWPPTGRRARGDAGAGGARGHRRPFDGRHRDLVVGGALSRPGVAARRCRRPDQHDDRRPAAPRAVPSGAATAGRRQGACGGHPAENLRRGTASACGRPAEPAVRVDDRGGPRRRPRHRRLHLRTVQRHSTRRPRRMGPRAGRLAWDTSAHRAEEPHRADAGDRQREGPSAADGVVAPHRQRGARISRSSSNCPAATARSWSAPTRSTSICAG